MIDLWRGEATVMKKKAHRKGKSSHAKSILRLPDLEVAKTSVINSLSCPDAQRGYRHAINEFVEWYCSEPRLSFSKTVVVRYRMHLESRHLAPGTINLLWPPLPQADNRRRPDCGTVRLARISLAELRQQLL